MGSPENAEEVDRGRKKKRNRRGHVGETKEGKTTSEVGVRGESH